MVNLQNKIGKFRKKSVKLEKSR